MAATVTTFTKTLTAGSAASLPTTVEYDIHMLISAPASEVGFHILDPIPAGYTVNRTWAATRQTGILAVGPTTGSGAVDFQFNASASNGDVIVHVVDEIADGPLGNYVNSASYTSPVGVTNTAPTPVNSGALSLISGAPPVMSACYPPCVANDAIPFPWVLPPCAPPCTPAS